MKKRSWLSLGLFFTACCSLHATVLTGVGGSNNDPVPQDHGSFVQDTPNIALSWSPTGGSNNSRNQWEQYNNWPNGGDGGQVYQIDSKDNYSEHLITFTPQGGFDVRLNSLDLNVWGGGGATAVNWTVSGSVSGVLGSGTFTTPDGGAVTHNLNLTGKDTEVLTLTLLQTSGQDTYLAMDNLNFDQLPAGSVVYTTPANGAVEVPLSSSLQWNIATGKQIAGYYVYMGTTPTEMSRLNSSMLSKQTASYSVALESDNTYYWQIEQAMFTDPNGTSGIIHPAGDPNNYLADIWHFATVRSRVIFDEAYPQNSLVHTGDDATFTVQAQDPLGGTIIYQWYFDADPTTPEGAVALTNGSKYTGCDTASLTVKNAQLADQGSYYCSGLNASSFTNNSVDASLIIKRKLAHWSLDAASYENSYYTDLSGNNNKAAVTSTPSFADGLVDGDQNAGNAVNNGAVNLTTINGTASAGSFNPSVDTNMFTVSCWVNRQHIINDVAYNIIAAKRDGWSSGSESYWQFLITDTGVVRMQSRGLTTINTTALINPDQWHHTAVTFVNNYAKIYVDGMVVAQGDFYLAAGPDSTFRIGCNDLTNERFEGRLDDMQVFNYALSAEEIADLYFAETGEELCIYGRPLADVSGDCIVDLLDLGIIADRWLDSGYYPALP